MRYPNSWLLSASRRNHLLLGVVLTGLLLPPQAARADHYDPDAVSSSSTLFRGVAKEAQRGLGSVEAVVRTTDGALADLDLALALSEGAVDTRFHKLWKARLDERSTRFGREFQAAQEAIHGFESASEKAFVGAMERALTTLKANGVEDLQECVASGGALATLRGPGASSGKGSQCPGKDQSEVIGSLWDEDKGLKQDAAKLQEWPWPEVTGYGGDDPPLGFGGGSTDSGWVSPAELVQYLPEALELLEAIRERSDKARKQLMIDRQAIDPEAEDGEERVAAIREGAKGIRLFLSESKKALGAELWASLEKAQKRGKKEAWAKTGICLNPITWGGCQGIDHSQAVGEVLAADKKLQKRTSSLLEALGTPKLAQPK